MVMRQWWLVESGSGFPQCGCKINGATDSELSGIIRVHSLFSMQKGSQHLQSTWHSLHVEWAGKDGEVGGTAACNISACKTFLIKIKI